MKYYLRQQIIGSATELPITESQFTNILTSKKILTAAFAIEESYDLLVANYVELEQELLKAAAENLVHDIHEYQDFFYLRATINRRVVNLLTTSRLYLDQIPQYISLCAADSDNAKIELKTRLSEHYDASIAYRFLEALRNHVQHCGLAVHKLSIGSRWTGKDELRALETSVVPFTVRSNLLLDKSFKQSVLSETIDEVNLINYIREYVERLGETHSHMRLIYIPVANEARTIIETTIFDYSKVNNGQTVGLAAVSAQSETEREVIPLLLDWDDVRLKLTKRNSSAVNLSKHFVSGR